MNSQSTNESVSVRRSKEEDSELEFFGKRKGKKGTSWTTIIIIIIVLILIALAIWYFVFKKKGLRSSAPTISESV